jgi:hypothetical protein
MNTIEIPFPFLCINGRIDRTYMLDYMYEYGYENMYFAIEHIFTWMEDNGYNREELLLVFDLLEEAKARNDFDYVMDELFINAGYCEKCDMKKDKCDCVYVKKNTSVINPNKLIKNNKQ